MTLTINIRKSNRSSPQVPGLGADPEDDLIAQFRV
jgi:hypothetical protein